MQPGPDDSIKVLRENQELAIPSSQLVPGDLLLLEPGILIPVDARVIESWELQVDESIFSNLRLVHKHPYTNGGGNDAANVYAGSVVITGQAKALVYATSERRRIVAEDLTAKLKLWRQRLYAAAGQDVESRNHWEFIIVGICLLAMAFVEKEYWIPSLGIVWFLLPLRDHVSLLRIMVHSVEVVSNLAAATVYRLSSLQESSKVDIVVTDKSGTLTDGQPRVTSVLVIKQGDEICNVGTSKVASEAHSLTPWLLSSSLGCNEASLKGHRRTSPLEQAIMDYCMQPALPRCIYDRIWAAQNFFPKVVEEVLFDAAVRYAGIKRSSLNAPARISVYKGAIPEVLARCNKVWIPKGDASTPAEEVLKSLEEDISVFSDSVKESLLSLVKQQTETGERAMAFALCFEAATNDSNEEDGAEEGWIFGGIMMMKDPVMGEVEQQVAALNRAGIRVILASGKFHPFRQVNCIDLVAWIGDDKNTAKVAAFQSRIPTEVLLSGQDLEGAQDQVLKECCVFYRMTPMQKQALVNKLELLGHQVAWIGDGLRDRPALEVATLSVTVTKQTASNNAKQLPLHLRFDAHGWSRRFVTIVEVLKVAQQTSFWFKRMSHLDFVYLAVVVVLTVGAYMKTTLFTTSQLLSLEILRRWWFISVWKCQGFSHILTPVKFPGILVLWRLPLLLTIIIAAGALALISSELDEKYRWHLFGLVNLAGPVLAGYTLAVERDGIPWYLWPRLEWFGILGIGYALLHISWMKEALGFTNTLERSTLWEVALYWGCLALLWIFAERWILLWRPPVRVARP